MSLCSADAVAFLFKTEPHVGTCSFGPGSIVHDKRCGSVTFSVTSDTGKELCSSESTFQNFISMLIPDNQFVNPKYYGYRGHTTLFVKFLSGRTQAVYNITRSSGKTLFESCSRFDQTHYPWEAPPTLPASLERAPIRAALPAVSPAAAHAASPARPLTQAAMNHGYLCEAAPLIPDCDLPAVPPVQAAVATVQLGNGLKLSLPQNLVLIMAKARLDDGTQRKIVLWCHEQKAVDLDEVLESMEDIVRVCGLTKLEAKRLQKVLDEAKEASRQLPRPGTAGFVFEVGNSTDVLRLFAETSGNRFVATRAEIVVCPDALTVGVESYMELLELRRGDGLIFNPAAATDASKVDLLEFLKSKFRTGEVVKGKEFTKANALFCWHGVPSEGVARNICNTGFAPLSSLDPGYHANGRYLSTEAEYAAMYANGQLMGTQNAPNADGEWALLLCVGVVGLTWAITPCAEDYTVVPPTRAEDCKFFGAPIKAKYDSHFVAVGAPNWFAVEPRAPHQRQFHEIVFSQDNQILPVAIVWFKGNGAN